jgi:hypothetical protein
LSAITASEYVAGALGHGWTVTDTAVLVAVERALLARQV